MKMLFEFARKLNNYRNFESDEDMYNLIDEFLTEYKPYDQPERSKREDFCCQYCLNFLLFNKDQTFCSCGKANLIRELFNKRCGALNTMET